MATMTVTPKKKSWFVRFMNMDTSGSKGGSEKPSP